MDFLIDESSDARLIPFLISSGHDVQFVPRDYQRGLSDEQVLSIAVRENRILIADDRDFGELVFRRRLSHAGIILLRLSTDDLLWKQKRLAHVLSRHAGDLRKFIVVSDHDVRIRMLT